MHAFQEFQRDFGRHIRDPRGAARPAGVPTRRMAIYNELLYNNLEGFLLACFPVTRQVLGARRWSRLVRAFFREARCRSPWFREIPREFLDWLRALESPPVPLPPWVLEMAHYEWVELALDVSDVEDAPHDVAGDLLAGVPVLAPALMNLSYAWPVHRIGVDWRPRKPAPARLLVYRDRTDRVRFVELNPVTARLIEILAAGRLGGRAACLAVAAEIDHPQPEAVAQFGAALLAELRDAGAVIGVRP